MTIIGDIPKGLPYPQIIQFGSWTQVYQMIPAAVLVSIITFLDAVSIGRTFAIQAKYEIGVNNEFLALGMANFVGGIFLKFLENSNELAWFSCYPSTGSFSRTAVNAKVGAKSGKIFLILFL